MSLNRRRFLLNTGMSVAGLAATFKSVACASQSSATNSPFDAGDWTSIREQFGVSSEYVHLSSFFLASHPAPVRDAIEKHRRELDSNPFMYVEHEGFRKPFKVEKTVAEYVGGRPEEIALTDSTTMGLALVYHGLPLKVGQEILTTVHDHYATHESIRLAAERSGATIKKIKLYDDFKSISEEEIVSRISKAITPKTRVVGVTWVHSSSGLKLPLRAIATAIAQANKNRTDVDRVLLVVDGVHGLGVEDETIAQIGVDIFAAGTHKWMFGPRGTGFIWAKTETWKMMKPVIPSFSDVAVGSWMTESRIDDPAFLKRASDYLGREIKGVEADWFSPGGFHSFEHRWALPAAFDFHKQIGRARIAERVHTLNDQAKETLAKMPKIKLYTPRGNKLSAGLICFDAEGLKPAEVVEKLLAKKVIATTTPYTVRYARIAPSLLNTPEEIDKTMAYIREML